ncbi:HupE/UreJ family protein [Neobacillus drentensis]|uniref:HupE/UreJ family protein n=1 Tax=Neobacillus drentensis TaxID=220684 RepID=UPI001F409446|nr:HupE/UreJ family protein [Neobacillus drentensis]
MKDIIQILKVVTAFTAAHTVALILASMHIPMQPERFFESLIALSIIYVAINSVLNRNMKHNLWLAFGFGLIHGLCFSGSLAEMRMDGGHFVSSLLTFNLGIEAGQILLELAIFPVLHFIRKVKWSFPAISASISIFGAISFVESAFLLSFGKVGNVRE